MNGLKTLSTVSLFLMASLVMSALGAPSAWNALGNRDETLATFESEMFGRRPV